MKSRLLGTVFVAILLTSCATAYQKQSYTGGFSETQLGENIFQIAFKGNAYTSRERASDFTLLRSAEVVVEKGFRYFIIVDSEKYSKTGTYTTPTTYQTTGSAHVSGNYIRGSSRTTTSGGQTYTYSKPTTTNTIVCYKDNPEGGGLVYDASFVAKSIKAKYGSADKRASDASLVAKSVKVENGLVGKQDSNDVKGWHKTHWGMSLSELGQTYQTNLKKTCKEGRGRCIYTLELVKLYGTPFDVEFYLANESNLNRITVSNEFKKENQLKLAEKIEAELKKQYGNPKVLNDEREHTEPRIAEDGRPIPGMNILELQWKFPSTTIIYYRSITKYLATNATVVHSVISLDYKANDPSKL